jgi:hypothetical protein
VTKATLHDELMREAGFESDYAELGRRREHMRGEGEPNGLLRGAFWRLYRVGVRALRQSRHPRRGEK